MLLLDYTVLLRNDIHSEVNNDVHGSKTFLSLGSLHIIASTITIQ